ncbi:hypothetical protein L596_010690 [Steinernema carpocapsae]|uniref:Homeobox domain-containing protein n=1 Tax=Steinernema carpocapsae TaxID=34508 RepID=A0A4U5PJ16_STECR|nr:hypothetical protein L596_010690 [Steinernema carpocapsae]
MVIVDSISDEMPPAQQIQAKTMEPVLKDVIMEDAHDDLENNPKAAEAQSEANREDSAESNHIEDSYASTLSAADKKAEAQAQNKRMEMWLEANDNNLYPSRPDKEKLAEEMGVPLLTITRWFSNRRRKQSKRPKISTSAEDRNRHIEDIVDFVVQRANAESFSSPDPSSSDEKLDSATDESAATVTENNQKTPDMAEMMKFYDEVWIKALKMDDRSSDYRSKSWAVNVAIALIMSFLKCSHAERTRQTYRMCLYLSTLWRIWQIYFVWGRKDLDQAMYGI